jgi:hypothetical protein
VVKLGYKPVGTWTLDVGQDVLTGGQTKGAAPTVQTVQGCVREREVPPTVQTAQGTDRKGGIEAREKNGRRWGSTNQGGKGVRLRVKIHGGDGFGAQQHFLRVWTTVTQTFTQRIWCAPTGFRPIVCTLCRLRSGRASCCTHAKAQASTTAKPPCHIHTCKQSNPALFPHQLQQRLVCEGRGMGGVALSLHQTRCVGRSGRAEPHPLPTASTAFPPTTPTSFSSPHLHRRPLQPTLPCTVDHWQHPGGGDAVAHRPCLRATTRETGNRGRGGKVLPPPSRRQAGNGAGKNVPCWR